MNELYKKYKEDGGRFTLEQFNEWLGSIDLSHLSITGILKRGDDIMITSQDLQTQQNLIHAITHKYNVLGYEQEDLFQECMTKLWEVRELYNDEYSLTTFVYTVCTNYLSTLARRETNEYNVNRINGKIKPNIKDYDLSQYMEDSIYNQKQLDAIYTALDMMCGHRFEDDVYRYTYGETMTEIGKDKGLSRQIISRRFMEYIKDVREELL